MPSWADFAAADPDLAATGQRLLNAHGVLLLGTLAADGFPRLSPLEPLFLDGQIYLGMMWQSRKALDLLRDPRCAIINPISDRTGTEGEFKAVGRARTVEDPEERDHYGAALFAKLAWRPDEPYHLFRLDLLRAALLTYDGGHQHIRRWPAV